MNIVMMTNTYHPIVGGLEKSVEMFSAEYRDRGHNVLIVCPEFDDSPKNEKNVFRVPAMQNFNDTDFSVELPIPNNLKEVLKKFKPDIIHTHHPFLVGDTALRISSEYNIPIIFTNHTLYEKNTHYVPWDSKAMKKFVIELAKGYANLCDRVIAPSQSVADLLKSRGVKTPVHVVPTGLYLENFKKGSGRVFRKFFDIPPEAFVIGIIGRVAKEKNVDFLAKTICTYMEKDMDAYFVVVGSGPLLDEIKETFAKHNIQDRLICTGTLQGNQLVSAYKALDVFTFASHSETQGLVLVESMACGTPVVAVDAPGVREVLDDKNNGRLIADDNVNDFVDALYWMKRQSAEKKLKIRQAARKTAREFAVAKCVSKALKIYRRALKEEAKHAEIKNSHWAKTKRVLAAQADLITNYTKATSGAIRQIPEEAIKKITENLKDIAENIFKQK